ncbi:MAG TPA: folylpolyglutamate synthase/dihydrofolate synthase family protein [Thermoanaerobaculia bacterium]|nr:folylpolyglutamate synthase/dihydrofolate synthase family protein [Thermoanaerobaculia bacterium]
MPLPPEAARALEDLQRFGMHLGLGHVRRLLAELDDPHTAVPSVVVAGTNGKGSTSALLASIAEAAGYHAGLYTSPHLQQVEERVRVDGRDADGELLGEAILDVVAAAGRVLDDPPTYFEALTAAAFLVFRRAGVELAVLEVGLGGRLDAVNVAEPELSVITPVSLEHRGILGDTLLDIAREKAAVLRRGRPAVAWGEAPEVRQALLGAEVTFADDEVSADSVERLGWQGQRFHLTTPVRRYDLHLPLLGRHQRINLALAVRAAELLLDHGWRHFDAAAIRAGAAHVRWPGRLEVLEPPAGGEETTVERVLLDAAHNPHGAEALAGFLAEVTEEEGEPPPALLFGVLDDKEAERMLPLLAERAGKVVLTRPPGDRGRDPEELVGLLPEGCEAEVVAGVEDALQRALATAGRAKTLVVCGSIFLIGAVRGQLL